MKEQLKIDFNKIQEVSNFSNRDIEIKKSYLNKFIENDLLNILFVGDSGSCKTTLINIICKQYYGEEYDSNNVLIINSLKEQGISYYRTEVKTFCLHQINHLLYSFHS